MYCKVCSQDAEICLPLPADNALGYKIWFSKCMNNSKLPLVFLEAHNMRDVNGLGIFCRELIKAMSQINTRFRLRINIQDKEMMSNFPSPLVEFNRYHGLQRDLGIWQRVDIWHSLNQRIKIEPMWAKKYVLTIHDTIDHDRDYYRKRLEKKLKRADAITYISNYVREDTHRLYDVPKGIPEYIIYNGNPISELLDTSDYRPDVDVSRPYLYALGQFSPRKNFHALVEMMRVNKDFNLIISGEAGYEGYAGKVRQMIADNNLTDRVFLTGIVSEQGKQFYLRNAAAFLLPSLEEGFGLPIIEAMRFGKPVFLSQCTCIPEIGGKDAYYFPNFDAEEMNRTLTEGMHHYQQNREVIEQRMRERAALFSWEKAASEYLQVYADVMSK